MLHNSGTALQALLHSYSCLDFASILDVTQLRVHKLRKLMKDRVQNRCSVLLLFISASPQRACCTAECC